MFYEQYDHYLSPTDPLSKQLEMYGDIQQYLNQLDGFASRMNVVPRVLIEPVIDTHVPSASLQ